VAPEIGDRAPDFDLPSTAGRVHFLEQAAGKKIVLVFYAEDATPTCSSQVSALKNDFDLILELGASVLAVSADSLESHKGFVESLGGLPFPLVSDTDLQAAKAFGVADESGKRSRRAIFVVEDGLIRLAIPWFNPSNSQQYQQVFEALGIS